MSRVSKTGKDVSGIALTVGGCHCDPLGSRGLSTVKSSGCFAQPQMSAATIVTAVNSVRMIMLLVVRFSASLLVDQPVLCNELEETGTSKPN
jgi:hypothetical protein